MGQQKNHMWTFLRQTDIENQNAPNQTRNKTEITQYRLVGYLPTINAPPPATDRLMVNKILSQAMKIARKLDIKVVCISDQALHVKVIDILWKGEEKCIQ